MSGTTIYIIFSVTSIAVSSVLALLFWMRRKAIGALALCLLLTCAAEWSLSLLLSALSNTEATKILFDNFSFIGAVFTPVAWFIFSVYYTRQERVLSGRHFFLLSLIPVITLIVLFVDNSYGLFITGRNIEHLANSTLHIIGYKFGPWFWVHIAYTNFLMFAGMIILLQGLIKTIRIYRNQTLIMMSAVLVPFIGTWLYLLGLGPDKNLDTTTFSFTISGVLLFIGMFRFNLLDLVPIAREAVIETMSDLVIVLDNQNRVIDINKAARAILGKVHQGLIGQHIQVLSEKVNVFTEVQEIQQDENHLTLQIEGKKRYYDIKQATLYNKKNSVIGSFLVLNDITDLRETMESLKQSKRAAENASKVKSEFLATMSHEIRTPINGIIGMAELLEGAKLTPQQLENLKALQYSADSLLNIINEILDFSKIEAGKMLVDRAYFSLRDLVSNIAKTFSLNSKTKSIQFSYDVDEDVPDKLVGDYAKLRQILTNLLSNAFKFTERGAIHIHIRCLERVEQEAVLAFSVSDTGIGIPQDKIDRLFESFHQLDSSTTRKYGGTGLGLSIVKKLVALMKGSIRVESTVGQGSCFKIELPFGISEELHEGTEAALSLETENRRLKILIAEDSRVNQLLIKQLIERKGWDAKIYENGAETLAELNNHFYDLILMDIQMPIMDGYQTTQAIRQREVGTGRHIPIIALTANATSEDRAKSISCGMDDFLSKPVKSEKLYETILKHLRV